MTTPNTGRTMRVREHLAKHPKGSTVLQLIAAVEPDCPYNRMSATVSNLVRAGKAKAKDAARGRTLYQPTATTLVDARVQANATTGAKRRAKAKPGRRRPAAAAARPTERTQPRPRPKQGDALRQVIGGLARAPQPTRVGPTVAAGNAETVDQFLARGGRIQRLPHGASATPLFSTLHDINEASMRRRKARLAGAI